MRYRRSPNKYFGLVMFLCHEAHSIKGRLSVKHEESKVYVENIPRLMSQKQLQWAIEKNKNDCFKQPLPLQPRHNFFGYTNSYRGCVLDAELLITQSTI